MRPQSVRKNASCRTRLLSDPARFDIAFPEPEHEEAVSNLAAMAAGFASPELIDDGPETAPSKRIIRVIPEYERRKALAGPLIAARIGLDVIRGKCRHFHKWLEKIEALSGREVG